MGATSSGPRVVTRQVRAQTLAICVTGDCGFTEVREAKARGGPVPAGTVTSHLLANPGHDVREIAVAVKSSRVETGDEAVALPAPVLPVASDEFFQEIVRMCATARPWLQPRTEEMDAAESSSAA
jgi:hypothetical protein